MILHLKRTKKTPETLATPGERDGISSSEVLEAHEKHRAKRGRMPPVSLAKGSAKAGEPAAAKSGGSPTEVLSLVTLPPLPDKSGRAS